MTSVEKISLRSTIKLIPSFLGVNEILFEIPSDAKYSSISLTIYIKQLNLYDFTRESLSQSEIHNRRNNLLLTPALATGAILCLQWQPNSWLDITGTVLATVLASTTLMLESQYWQPSVEPVLAYYRCRNNCEERPAVINCSCAKCRRNTGILRAR